MAQVITVNVDDNVAYCRMDVCKRESIVNDPTIRSSYICQAKQLHFFHCFCTTLVANVHVRNLIIMPRHQFANLAVADELQAAQLPGRNRPGSCFRTRKPPHTEFRPKMDATSLHESDLFALFFQFPLNGYQNGEMVMLVHCSASQVQLHKQFSLYWDLKKVTNYRIQYLIGNNNYAERKDNIS